ncbi:hypothetical protein IOK49_06475 [Fervidicoccus fontis]|uniref:Prepilin type IV endopeptidase peptidase domain-containing protein n=1 Tax=Fervidicoccus fontis TaxID=683846 RepID=A0A843AJF7_9CREN|nr:hypothetical protein [Fervidicoccus fontis]MBE9391709.1 hypothetical protein [Fervidicoccus fontis]
MSYRRKSSLLSGFYLFILFALNALFFGYVGIVDLKYREIDDKAFYCFIPIILILSIYSYFQNEIIEIVNIIIGAFLFIFAFFMSRSGFIGSADAFIISYVFFLNPYVLLIRHYVMPAGIFIIITSLLLSLLLIFKNIIINLKRVKYFRDITNGLGLLVKIYYFLFCETLNKEEFKKKKFYFVVATKSKKRIYANVEKEPFSFEEKGIKTDWIIAMYGIPLGFFIFLGLLLTYMMIFLKIILVF